ncbi:unnamed protein product [Lampetra fluviatilis]
MARCWLFSWCRLPASWHFSCAACAAAAAVPRAPPGAAAAISSCCLGAGGAGGAPPAPRRLLALLLALATLVLLCGLYVLGAAHSAGAQRTGSRALERFLEHMLQAEATDTLDAALSYGVVVDCGSSGTRVFVYVWPPHNGNPHDLLDIRQMRDRSRNPVVKKIKPGISTLAPSPEKASDYIRPLLSFAASHIPLGKHRETPLYILCTAGMRLLPDSLQEAILEDLRTDIPLEFDFLFSDSHVEVISGKQEGVYAWIGINFVLDRFNHVEEEEEDEGEEAVGPGGGAPHAGGGRKRTVGILDMGGASTQVAYEVPKSVSFGSGAAQEEIAKSSLAEFNLGCDEHHTQHIYRVFVTTFLGSGANAVRQRYEQALLNATDAAAALNGDNGTARASAVRASPSVALVPAVGGAPAPPLVDDPCLPAEAADTVERRGGAGGGTPPRRLLLRGAGDFDGCRAAVRPFLTGALRPPLDLPALAGAGEFYGFSEFYYCTEDVLRIGGAYDARRYAKAAAEYCATRWGTLVERFERKLYSPHADTHRLKYQCFKSAWVYEMLHSGLGFPESYAGLRTAQLVYDKEVQWTLGAILYRTRFLPLRDMNQQQGVGEGPRGPRSPWRRYSSFLYNPHLFSACFLVVALAILLYLLRLRRIHRRLAASSPTSSASSALLWMEEGGAP